MAVATEPSVSAKDWRMLPYGIVGPPEQSSPNSGNNNCQLARLCQISSCFANDIWEKRNKHFFLHLSVFWCPRSLLGQSSPISALCTARPVWQILSPSDNQFTSYLLPNFVDFIDSVTNRQLTISLYIMQRQKIHTKPSSETNTHNYLYITRTRAQQLLRWATLWPQ